MTPVRIEERPDVVVDGGASFGLGRPRTAMDEFRLQGREEALGDRVASAVADAAHAADDATSVELGSIDIEGLARWSTARGLGQGSHTATLALPAAQRCHGGRRRGAARGSQLMDSRLDVLDRARRYLNTFPPTSLDPFEEWELVQGMVGFARELVELKTPLDRIEARFKQDLGPALLDKGLAATDIADVVKTASNGQMYGRVKLVDEARRTASQKRAPEPEASPRTRPTQNSPLERSSHTPTDFMPKRFTEFWAISSG